DGIRGARVTGVQTCALPISVKCRPGGAAMDALKMWTRYDLKYRLTLRISGVATLCFAAICAYVLFDIARSADARNARIAEITARSEERRVGKQARSQGHHPA